LVKSLERVDPAVDAARASLQQLQGVSLGDTVDQLAKASAGLGSLKDAAKNFSNLGQGFKGLSAALTKVADATERLANSVAGLDAYNAKLAVTRDILKDMAAAGTVFPRIPRDATGGGGSGTARKPATTSDERFLNMLEKESILAKQGKVAYLELLAARKGLTAQATPFINTLKSINKENGLVGVSTKQVSAAMRMLPAQMSDVAVQLAGGQNPFLILLQQGSQVKDGFGGLGNTFKVLGPMILKFLMNPLTLAAAALAALGAGFVMGALEASKFGKALAATNNYIGIAQTNMYGLAESVGRIGGGTTARAAEVLTAMAGTAKITGDSVGYIATAITNFTAVTGTKVQDVADQFASLSKEPSKAILDLNEKTRFLTLGLLDQIMALEKQGRTQEAVTLAQNAYADELQKAAERSVESLGWIESGWLKVKGAVKGAADAIAGIGREDQTAMLRDLQEQLVAIQTIQAKGRDNPYIRQQISDLQKLIAAEEQRLAPLPMGTASHEPKLSRKKIA
jgi:phage-related minor tail protein